MANRTNALWFFAALLGGGTAVWWAKSAVADAWFAAIVAAGVVLALAIYYLLNDEDAPEEEGDNIYYLGLLFTLISLMFTLVELFGADTETAPNAEKIRVLLENFGIALTSTVVGVAGRVALQNWQRASPAEPRHPTEDDAFPRPPQGASTKDLEGFNRHVLERIARDLTQGANALARFHRIVRSHATGSEDHLRSHSETLTRETTEFKDTLRRDTETFVQELKRHAEGTIQAVAGSLEAVARQAEALLDQVRSTHADYDTELRETTRSFHHDMESSTSRSLDALRQTFGTVAQQANALPAELKTAHERYVDAIRDATQSSLDGIQSTANENLRAIERELSDAATQSVAVGRNLSGVSQRIDQAFSNFESGLGRAAHSSANLAENADQAAKSTASLDIELQKLGPVLQPLHSGTETLTSLLESLKEFNGYIRASDGTGQTATALRQIGDILQTIAAVADASTQRAAKAASLLDSFAQSVDTTESETRRATQALEALAIAAEARADALRENQKSSFPFWNRGR